MEKKNRRLVGGLLRPTCCIGLKPARRSENSEEDRLLAVLGRLLAGRLSAWRWSLAIGG